MSAGVRSIAFWGLKVPAGDEPTIAASELPGVHMFRLTMAAIDPTADPIDERQPKRATLKIIRRRLDFDEDDSEDDDNQDDEEKQASRCQISQMLKQTDKAIQKTLEAAGESGVGVDAKGDDSDDDGEHRGFETEEFVICTLDNDRTYQQPLDIIISEEEEVFFKVDGNYDVSISGNYIVPLGEDGNEEYSDGESNSDDDDYDLPPDEEELMNLMAGSESEDELDDVEEPRVTEIRSEEEEEEDAPKREAVKKLTKAEKKSLKRAAEEEEAKPEGPKLSKKQLKKLKANDGKAVAAVAETPDSKKKDAKQTPEKPATKQTPEKPATKQAPEKKAVEKNPEAVPSTRVVQGITIEDKTIGTGPVCKKGNKLGMRYIGKLNDKNGKVFDKNTLGKPFTFRLGKGEVIKGWDIGLVGMKVGGERRITIPASMGYGNKALPGIPANSTLCFDVKLLEVK